MLEWRKIYILFGLKYNEAECLRGCPRRGGDNLSLIVGLGNGHLAVEFGEYNIFEETFVDDLTIIIPSKFAASWCPPMESRYWRLDNCGVSLFGGGI